MRPHPNLHPLHPPHRADHRRAHRNPEKTHPYTPSYPTGSALDQAPLTARTHWVQQWCEQYIMTSTWETGQAAALRHLQATNLKTHINRFTQEATRQLR